MYLRKILLTTVAALSLVACSDDNNPFDQVFGEFRVANAIADAAPIDAELEGIPSDINDITFGTGSSLREFPQGNYEVTMRTTNNSVTTEFSEDPVDIDGEDMTTAYAIGRLSQSSQNIFVVKAPDTDVPSNQTEVQFVHVASSRPVSLDIYLTAPAADLLTATPTATLSYPGNNTQSFFTPGNYRVRVTPAGDKTTVLYDSGTTGIQLVGGATQQLALIDNSNTSLNVPLNLLILDGLGGSRTVPNLSS